MSYSSPEDCVNEIIKKVGPKIRMAVPLGIGKPNLLLNAIYKRVKEDSTLELTIYSALTLQKPVGTSDLSSKFLDPFVERVFKDYPDLDFELDRVANKLPQNIRVVEFYFPAGKFVNHPTAQKDYMSSNYTHVARDLFDARVNVVAQLVSPGAGEHHDSYSLSCNADVSLDLMESLNRDSSLKDKFIYVAELNANLPFMFGQALVSKEVFHLELAPQSPHFQLFGVPKLSVGEEDYLIGLHGSALIKDGGELQIGIGSLGDALVYALIMRHEENAKYREVIKSFGISDLWKDPLERWGGLAPFEEGLFGATEMLVDGFLHLFKAGIMKRKVYDHVVLQRLLNEGLIKEEVELETLTALLARGAISAHLTQVDFEFLQYYGIFRKELKFINNEIVLEDGFSLPPSLEDTQVLKVIKEKCLGEKLKHGAVLHGGFFVGCQEFYSSLNQLTEDERQKIHMKSVSSINQLYGHEELDRLHRREARFVNTCLMVSLLGGVTSDTLANGQVISGVGGQYNFVSMAHALKDGRSIIQVRSTRASQGKLQSNIVWNYGQTTIPRHLRDIVISEYGIASLRGKTDQEVIEALLNITDSRFQGGLMKQAIRAGKLRKSYRIPDQFRANSPKKYKPQFKSLRLKSLRLKSLRQEGLFPSYPFGTDFTSEEMVLGKALKGLKAKKKNKLLFSAALIKAALSPVTKKEEIIPYLERMGMLSTQQLKDRVMQNLLVEEILKALP